MKLFFYAEERLAFLDLLIKSAEDGAQLTDDDIREEVDTVMFAVRALVTISISIVF